jgi:hypothetical protein
MLNSKEIKDKAERSYKDFLLSVLKREIFFPFHIKGNKGNANLPLQDLYPALKHLIDNSKEKLGYGYSLTYKEVNTRHSGIITMPDAIFFENPQDYLKFMDKEQAFTAFRKAVDLTRRQTPSLLKWIEDNVLKCQKNAEDWADILKIVQYFIEKPKPNCYWRQLPVAADLSAVEAYQPIIAELLEAVLPPQYFNQNEPDFAPRFGLLYDEPSLRIRFLDKNQIQPLFGEDISLPISTWANWQVENYENIYFITDKNVFLSFPNTPLPTTSGCAISIAVLWEHSLDILPKIAWFQSKNCYFIGDISSKGFEQLSEMRSILRGIKPLMMDKTTFEAFPQHHQTLKVTTTNPFLTHLTAEEQAFYQFLLGLKEQNGLLQRDIPYSFLEKTVILM